MISSLRLYFLIIYSYQGTEVSSTNRLSIILLQIVYLCTRKISESINQELTISLFKSEKGVKLLEFNSDVFK